MNNFRYVLLTAAKDEEACIGEVIQAVLRQTVRPLAWFIMDDGSTDQTAAIIKQYAAGNSFIHFQSGDSRERALFRFPVQGHQRGLRFGAVAGI